MISTDADKARCNRQVEKSACFHRRSSATAAVIFPELRQRGVEIDIVTDQTSAPRPAELHPVGVELADAADYAAAKPEEFTDRARASMARHVAAMVGFLDAGAEVFDYGNSIRGEAKLGGFERAFDFPGFVPRTSGPLFAEGKGPFRWAALSGDPADIAATDRAVPRPVPGERAAGPLDQDGRRAGRLPGPARRGSAGSATASGTRPACGSTTWSPAARSARPS
jgi:urocanate hydratase